MAFTKDKELMIVKFVPEDDRDKLLINIYDKN